MQKSQRRPRAAVVCLHKGMVLALRVVDPIGEHTSLILPGGAIEEGEKPAEAAVRETFEKTGYTVAVKGQPIEIDHDYLWSGSLRKTSTKIFRGALDFEARIEGHESKFIREILWVPVNQIGSAFQESPDIVEVLAKFCK